MFVLYLLLWIFLVVDDGICLGRSSGTISRSMLSNGARLLLEYTLLLPRISVSVTPLADVLKPKKKFNFWFSFRQKSFRGFPGGRYDMLTLDEHGILER